MAGHTERCYRHCSPDHEDIGAGTLAASQRAGGRFNPPGEFGALYLACESATAVAELRRRAEGLGIEPGDLLPRTLLTVDAKFRQVLDLTEPAVRREWGLEGEVLSADDLSACQEVGSAARRAGYEAIRFPSATGSGTNLAVFLDRLHPGSEIEVVDSRSLDLSGPDPEAPTFPGLEPPQG